MRGLFLFERRIIMQKMVDKIYKQRKLDKIRPVTQYEYQQREIRTRLDVADIYSRLINIYTALEESGIKIETDGTDETLLVDMVEEDLLSAEIDFEQKKYEKRVEAYEKGSIIEYVRRLFTGQPIVPLFDMDTEESIEEIKVPQSVNQARKAKVEVEKKNEEEERIVNLLKSVEKKGGVKNATKKEKDELKSVLEEIKQVVEMKEELVPQS